MLTAAPITKRCLKLHTREGKAKESKFEEEGDEEVEKVEEEENGEDPRGEGKAMGGAQTR